MFALDKAEYRNKLEEINSYAEAGAFREAALIADEIDWKHVKSVRTLCMIGEIYEANRRYEDSARILKYAYKRSSSSKTVLYRLADLDIRNGEYDEAKRLINEFEQNSPNDTSRYILRYKLMRAEKAPLDDQIAVLREYKDHEYTERWAYELAKLYKKNGQKEKCIEECDDLILWFMEGKYVTKAMELKMQLTSLTPAQQAAYDARSREDEKNTVPVKDENSSLTGLETVEKAILVAADEDEEETRPKVSADDAIQRMDQAAGSAVQIPETEMSNDEPDQNRQAKTGAGGFQKKLSNSIRAVFSGLRRTDEEDEDADMKIAPDKSERDVAPSIPESAVPVESVSWVHEELRKSVEEGQQPSSDAAVPAAENAAEEKEGTYTFLEEKNVAAAATTVGAAAATVAGAAAAASLSAQGAAEAGGASEQFKEVAEAGAAPLPAQGAPEVGGASEQFKEVPEAGAVPLPAQGAAEAGGASEQFKEVAEAGAASLPAQGAAEASVALEQFKEVPEAGTASPAPEEAENAGKASGIAAGAVAGAGIASGIAIAAAASGLYKGMNDDELPEEEKPAGNADDFNLDALFAETGSAFASEVASGGYVMADTLESDREQAEADAVKARQFGTGDSETAGRDQLSHTENLIARETDESLGLTRELHLRDAIREELNRRNSEGPKSPITTPEEAAKRTVAQAYGKDLPEGNAAVLYSPVGLSATLSGEDGISDEEILRIYGTDEALRSELLASDLDIPEVPEEDTDEALRNLSSFSGEEGGNENTLIENMIGEPDSFVIMPVEGRQFTEPEKKAMSYFASIPGVDYQVTSALADIHNNSGDKTSRSGNVVIMGRQGSGKTRLAEGLILITCMHLGIKAAKEAHIVAEALNKKDPAEVVKRMAGGFLIIEAAGSMSDECVLKLNQAMETRTDALVIIIEDEKADMKKLLDAHPEFAEKFTSRITVPVFTNDELVTFARTYAKEEGYKFDEMATLALYTMIGDKQRDSEPMTVGKVRALVDRAIERNSRKLFGKTTDKEDGRIVLTEKDFNFL